MITHGLKSGSAGAQSSLRCNKFVDLDLPASKLRNPSNTFTTYDSLSRSASSQLLLFHLDTLNPQYTMATRGPVGSRGGNSRFAQFKLVLLGTLPLESYKCHIEDICANNDNRRICRWKGVNLRSPSPVQGQY